jgi:hypothetical protein
MVLTNSSSCARATRRRLHHIETRRGNNIVHESWNHDENRRRAEEGNDNIDENNQNQDVNDNKDEDVNDNQKEDVNDNQKEDVNDNPSNDMNDNSNNDGNDEQTNDNQNSYYSGTVSKVGQDFMDMFYNSPSEWTTEHWCAFAGLVTLVVISVLWWCITCFIPSCCPNPGPRLQPKLIHDVSSASSISDSPYTSEESHSSDEEPYHEYDEWGQRYIKYTNSFPPTYSG